MKVVVIGSSSAAGKNLDEPKYGGKPGNLAWPELFARELAKARPGSKLVNLAKSGTTSFDGMPTGTKPVAGSPAPDPERNVTAALALKPSLVIVAYQLGNGASTKQVLANLATIAKVVEKAGARVWVATPIPRPSTDPPDTIAQTAELSKSILEAFRTPPLDFRTPLANADGLQNSELFLTDGKHPNQKGHQVLARVVMAASAPAATARPAAALPLPDFATPIVLVTLIVGLTATARARSSARAATRV